jgi:hypothetical protein
VQRTKSAAALQVRLNLGGPRFSPLTPVALGVPLLFTGGWAR